MNKEISLIPAHPFIQKFVFSIIQNIKAKNFDYESKIVIDADLIPRSSENIMRESLMRREPTHLPPIAVKRPESIKRDMSELTAPIREPRFKREVQGLVPPKKIILPPVQKAPVPTQPQELAPKVETKPPAQIEPPKQVISPEPPKLVEPKQTTMPPKISPYMGVPVDVGENYGKLAPLLADPTISLIECTGAGKLLVVGRGGRKQSTKVTLSEGEIRGILDRVADKAHIPLLEGVFRAMVDDFSISAVVSDAVGSKFIIKKSTPYDAIQ